MQQQCNNNNKTVFRHKIHPFYALNLLLVHLEASLFLESGAQKKLAAVINTLLVHLQPNTR